MMKTLLLSSLTCLAACGAAGQQDAANPARDTIEATAMVTENTSSTESADIYGISFKTIRGEDMPFKQFEGKAVLVVNTASRCGYTGQYAGLQELHETFSEQGLVVLGAPSNDFGGQEPGQEAEIKTFCEINYGVTFPLTSKVRTVGPEQHPFWAAAIAALGEKAQPKWNFHKVLLAADGTFVQAYPSGVKPADAELVADIERALPNAS